MSRRVALMLAGALVAVAMVAVFSGAPLKAATFKTVTTTFSNPNPVLIPTNSFPAATRAPFPLGEGQARPYPSQIAVSGFTQGRILDVNLRLNTYSHTFPDDVDVLLVSPAGRNAVLMSDVGGGSDVNTISLLLDDEAANFLPLESQMVGGRFKPTNQGNDESFLDPAPIPSGFTVLAAFDGSNPNGKWKLYVMDDAERDRGKFAGGWSLRIAARVPS